MEASRTKLFSRWCNISFDNKKTGQNIKEDLYAFQFFTQEFFYTVCVPFQDA